MLGFDLELAAVPLRIWVAGGAAALLLVFCAVAALRVRPALRLEVVMLGALLGATTTWALLDRGSADNLRAERLALEARAGDLAARALAPGSPLGCLDGLVGENVEAACEKALFASAASAAAAASYVAARLALLTEATAYGERGGADIDHLLLPLRHALEADRFGFLAHVLAARDGCTNENCDALALLHDAGRVRAHLRERTLNQLLEQYSTAWSQPPDVPVADAAQARATAANAQPPHKPVNIDFPTAASIPPVSIMIPEPKGPVLPGAAAAAAANPNPQPAAASARHARKHAAVPAPPAAASSAPTAAVEPIWPEPVPPAPSAPRAAAPANEGPLPVNPFPPRPEGNAGLSVGAQ